MSVNAFTCTVTQNASFSKANSGYASATAGPTQNAFSVNTTSGNAFLHAQALTSGSSYTADFVSGGNTDLVGTTANLTKIQSLWVGAFSGALRLETYQSGGINIPQLGTQSGYPSSGYGFLVNQGGVMCIADNLSGYFANLSATLGNLNIVACSGAAYFALGAQGL